MTWQKAPCSSECEEETASKMIQRIELQHTNFMKSYFCTWTIELSDFLLMPRCFSSDLHESQAGDYAMPYRAATASRMICDTA